jgi:membrane associated rhomboid family serine protease
MDFFRNIKYNFQRQGILTKIIVINVAVFLTVNIIGNLSHLQLLQYVALPIGGDDFLFRFWTLFTYMFTHKDFWHLFWNMVLFYFMSQIFFTIMGEKKMLYLYVMSGISGGALMLILGLTFPQAFGYSILIGASAAVLGVGAVMAIYSPDYRVYLFGSFEMKYKYFFLAIFVLNTIIDFSINTGGKISHMGGALFGVVYGYYLRKGHDLFDLNLTLKRKSKLKVVSNNLRNESYGAPSEAANDAQKMDELLDKISRSGYDSLTKKEKEELFRLSQKNK